MTTSKEGGRGLTGAETRVVKLDPEARRRLAFNLGTVARSLVAPPPPLDVRSLFVAHHRQLERALGEQARPGVFAFLLGPAGVQGSLWLSATEALRAGTIGRHGQTDLYLPDECRLSLRHCLVLVRRLGDGVRIHVVDLGSTAGLLDEALRPVQAVDADGHFFLHLPGSVLAFFPTGAPLPWDPGHRAPFESLAPRVPTEHAAPPGPRWGASSSRDTLTSVLAREGPLVAGAGLLRRDEASVGRLVFRSGEQLQRTVVGRAALDRGVVIGRDERCAGSEVLSDDNVSRVHALLLRRDGQTFLADAGSTNGTWQGGAEIHCAHVDGGGRFELGESGHSSVAWEPKRQAAD